MATGNFFRQVEFPQQQSYDDGVLFPTVLSPTKPTDLNLSTFEEVIRANKPWLESLLLKIGAILFRGFPVTSPSDFNDVVEAFSFLKFLYVGGRDSRTQIVGRVYTSNESPLDKEIPFHHEMSYVPVLGARLTLVVHLLRLLYPGRQTRFIWVARNLF